MRGSASVLALALVVGACSGGEAASTTVESTTTSLVTTTTAAPSTTTSTIALTTTTTTVAVVEGVPAEALALIGAPMPAVPEYPNGFDAEVWFEAYVAWNQWAFANPADGLESLDLWVVPGSEMGDLLTMQLTALAEGDQRILQLANSELTEPEVADEFIGDGVVTINGVVSIEGEGWLVDEAGGAVPEVFDDPPRRLIVGLHQKDEAWLLARWE